MDKKTQFSSLAPQLCLVFPVCTYWTSSAFVYPVPLLAALAVTFDGEGWTEGVQYQYEEGTGLFTTVPGQILVPAASYTQDPITGAYSVTPGVATLTVTGTI